MADFAAGRFARRASTDEGALRASDVAQPDRDDAAAAAAAAGASGEPLAITGDGDGRGVSREDGAARLCQPHAPRCAEQAHAPRARVTRARGVRPCMDEERACCYEYAHGHVLSTGGPEQSCPIPALRVPCSIVPDGAPGVRSGVRGLVGRRDSRQCE